MNVLVTGATGFIASHLIPHLASCGHTVVAAGHVAERIPTGQGITPLLWDHVLPPPEIPARLDAIVHLVQANVPFPDRADEMFSVNTVSTHRLLELARKQDVRRFVFTSTGSVYGPGDRPWAEDDPTGGSGYYAATKVAAERLIRAYADLAPHTIFRLFAPYGPGQRNRLVPGLINRVHTGATVTVADGQGPAFNPLHVSHLVDVLEQSLRATGNQLLNLGGDEALTVRQMATIIGRVLGREPIIQDQPGPADRFVGDVARLRGAYRLPEPLISFEDGVRSMVAA